MSARAPQERGPPLTHDPSFVSLSLLAPAAPARRALSSAPVFVDFVDFRPFFASPFPSVLMCVMRFPEGQPRRVSLGQAKCTLLLLIMDKAAADRQAQAQAQAQGAGQLGLGHGHGQGHGQGQLTPLSSPPLPSPPSFSPSSSPLSSSAHPHSHPPSHPHFSSPSQALLPAPSLACFIVAHYSQKYGLASLADLRVAEVR